MTKRIFQIGFNKCGTRSLAAFFQKNGLASVHWEEGRTAENYMRRKERGENPFADYPDTIFFSDMIKLTETELIEPYRDFRTIHRHFPDAYFILNTRHREDWVKSRSANRNFVRRYRRYLGCDSDAAVFDHWREAWDWHHADVLDYFSAFPGQLIVFRLGEDDGAYLAERMPDFALDPQHFGHEGKTLPKEGEGASGGQGRPA